jgi:hypothetical protein
MPRPAPAKPPARPALAERCPRRLAARLAVAAIVREWMRKRGVSTVELAELCEESASCLHDRLTGEKPMPVEIVAMLPERMRRHVFELLSDVVVDVAAA